MDLLTYFKIELQNFLDSNQMKLLVEGPKEDRATHDQIYVVKRLQDGSIYSRVKLTREFAEDNDKSHVDRFLKLEPFQWFLEDNLDSNEIIVIRSDLTFETQEFK